MLFGGFPVNLVPKSSWGQSLARLLPEETWQAIRRREIEGAGHRCEVCGRRQSKGLHCHEVWEYDDELHIQTLSCYAVLCERCHLVFHFGYAQTQGLADETLAWAARVAKKSVRQIEEELEEVYRDWVKRSAVPKWRIDVSCESLCSENILVIRR